MARDHSSRRAAGSLQPDHDIAARREPVPVRAILATIGLVLATLLLLWLIVQTRRVLVWVVVAHSSRSRSPPSSTGCSAGCPGAAGHWRPSWCSWCCSPSWPGPSRCSPCRCAREGVALAGQLPQLLGDARAGRGPVGDLLERTNALEYVQNNQDRLREFATGLSTPALGFLRGAATGVAGTVTVFVLAYLMVLEAPKATAGTLNLFDRGRAERIRRVGGDCAKTITGYLSGNLLISVICGLLTYAVLKVAGVPFPALIALFVAIADLIPLVGATLAASFYRHRSGLSLAGRVCLALARSLSSTAYTGDRTWGAWASEFDVQVVVIR